MTSIEAGDLTREALKERDIYPLDIRHEEDFEDWSIPGSHLLDIYDELKGDREGAKEALSRLPEDKKIVTICASGDVADIATDLLEEMGYDAETLEGGLVSWSRVHTSGEIPVGGDTDVIQVARPGTGCLSYLLISEGEALLVDPSQFSDVYEDLLDERDAELTGVADTHNHADHLSGRGLAYRENRPYYLHPANAGELEKFEPVQDGSTIEFGEASLDVIHTPGHTPGSVCYALDENALFTGDTLFLQGTGRPDLAAGDEEDLKNFATALYSSVQKLAAYPDTAFVLPAHHPGSPDPPEYTTLKDALETIPEDEESFVDNITSSIPETPPNFEKIMAANTGQAEVDSEEALELEVGPNRCAAE